MKSRPIPEFFIEDHHEAFIVWDYAIQKGIIHAKGNVLYNVIRIQKWEIYDPINLSIIGMEIYKI